MLNKTDIGRLAEQCSLRYLQQHGLQLLRTNYFSRYGEIDLIMLDIDDLCFIEVRARKTNAFVSATESINIRKQKKTIYTAQYFLQCFPEYEHHHCRFDVMAFDYQSISQFQAFLKNAKQQQSLNLQWIKDAYTM